MAISVTLHLSDDDEEDIYIEDIKTDDMKSWLRDRRLEGGVLCETYKGTTPFIPFDEVKSFWFNDEDFVDTETKPMLGLVH